MTALASPLRFLSGIKAKWYYWYIANSFITMKCAHTALVVLVLLAMSFVAQSELAFTVLGDW